MKGATNMLRPSIGALIGGAVFWSATIGLGVWLDQVLGMRIYQDSDLNGFFLYIFALTVLGLIGIVFSSPQVDDIMKQEQESVVKHNSKVDIVTSRPMTYQNLRHGNWRYTRKKQVRPVEEVVKENFYLAINSMMFYVVIGAGVLKYASINGAHFAAGHASYLAWLGFVVFQFLDDISFGFLSTFFPHLFSIVPHDTTGRIILYVYNLVFAAWTITYIFTLYRNARNYRALKMVQPTDSPSTHQQ
jgi:hypothetical protein